MFRPRSQASELSLSGSPISGSSQFLKLPPNQSPNLALPISCRQQMRIPPPFKFGLKGNQQEPHYVWVPLMLTHARLGSSGTHFSSPLPSSTYLRGSSSSAPSQHPCPTGSNRFCRSIGCGSSPTAEHFGVSAQIGSGVVRGSPEVFAFVKVKRQSNTGASL